MNEEAHGACIAHLFSPSKLFEGFCYTRDFIFKKLESPCPKDTPCQISMHANGSREEDFQRFIKIFLIQPLYLNKSESPSQSCFLPSLVEIGLVVLEKKTFKHFPIYYYVKI